jgi:hypothetical protein
MAAEAVELRLCQRDDTESPDAKEILRRVAMIPSRIAAVR